MRNILFWTAALVAYGMEPSDRASLVLGMLSIAVLVWLAVAWERYVQQQRRNACAAI